MVSNIAKEHNEMEKQLMELKKSSKATSSVEVNTQHKVNKRITFSENSNANNKRGRQDDTSDSDNNRANTTQLLSAQLENNGNNLKKVFDAINALSTNFNNYFGNKTTNPSSETSFISGGNKATYEDDFIYQD
jgi:hypothetical protein